MARKFVRIGSLQNIHIFDDGDFDGGIETDDTMKAGQAPVAGEDVLRLDDVGSTGIISGPGASTDNAIARWHLAAGLELQNSLITISDTGQLELLTTARVYRHIRVSGASWKLGVAAPTVSRLGVFPTLIFGVGDAAKYSLICPFRMAAGSVIDVVVDFTHRDAVDVGTAEWTLEYKSAAVGEDIVVGTTTISGISGITSQHDLTRVMLTTGIVGAVAQDVIGLKLSHTGGGTIGVNVDLIQAHFEFLMDKLGEPS